MLGELCTHTDTHNEQREKNGEKRRSFQENPQPTTYVMNFEAQNAACHELFINSFATVLQAKQTQMGGAALPRAKVGMGAVCARTLHSAGDELHTKFKTKTSIPSKLHPDVLIPSHPTALSHAIAHCQLSLVAALFVLSRLPLLENPNC